MAIEVLLRRSIEGVGTVGEVVRVKPGYARNFLFPNAFAAPVTPDSLRRIEKDKAAEAVRERELASRRQDLVRQLKDVTVTIEARAGEDGHLYGSVTPRQVVQRLEEMGYTFDERHMRFEAVRELGEYPLTLLLGGGVEATVKVWVVQDAQDALAMREAAAARELAEASAAEANPDLDAIEF